MHRLSWPVVCFIELSRQVAPIVRSGSLLFLIGLLNTNTLLCSWLATNRLLAVSTATPVGWHRGAAEPHVPVMVTSGTISVVKGLLYSSIRSLPVSAT